MFEWFSNSRKKSSPRVLRRSSIGVEPLESRFCLSGPGGAPPASPPLLSLTARVLPAHWVQLRGCLADANPSGATVNFGDAVNASTSTDSAGNFSFLTQSASIGQVNAVATDAVGDLSNVASADVSPEAPTLQFSLTYASGGKVTLSGHVNDIDPGGRAVSFSGVVNTSVVTAADGSFTLTTSTQGTGQIQAIITDQWGLVSNTAQVAFNPSAPVIQAFAASEGAARYWTFTGIVRAPEAGGMMVTLGGLPSLEGHTTPVSNDGTWSMAVQLVMGEFGTATADTTDWWGQAAVEVMVPVSQS